MSFETFYRLHNALTFNLLENIIFCIEYNDNMNVRRLLRLSLALTINS